MWPLWLIIAVAAGGAFTLTASTVLVVVKVERKRHQRIVSQGAIDRNLSQYHRPHLSINDVDFANIPCPGRSLRQSLQASHRDSRFYTTMASEDEIRTFPDGTAESLATTSFVHTDADRSHQWLNPSKSKKLEKRKKKPIQLSISAPMARSPMSVITEQTEPMRQGSPEPVELPAHTTPKVTPKKIVAAVEPLPTHSRHTAQSSIDSIVDLPEQHKNRVSTRICNGNAIKSRSISVGNIAPPPNCPLPPVPEGRPVLQARQPSMSRSISEHSTAYRDISLLNSPMSSMPIIKSTIIIVQPSGNFSGFNFGLDQDNVQVVQVNEDKQSHNISRKEMAQHPVELSSSKSVTSRQVAKQSQDTSPRWNLPTGLQHLGPTSAQTHKGESIMDCRPVSIMSATQWDGPLNSHRPSPVKSVTESSSRPISVSSVDFFRQSVIGPNVPVLSPNSPRTKGHKRQNCIRISGLTPVDQAKKRLSSQLDRLAEAEETEEEDAASTRMEIPTISPARQVSSDAASAAPVLSVTKIRQPQVLSLRVRRPGLLTRDGSLASPTKSENGFQVVSPLERPTNPITRSKTVEPRFVYAGSPKSDPTRLPPRFEYSPVSPSASIHQKEAAVSGTEEKVEKQEKNDSQTFYSPASTSMLFSAESSPAAPASSGSPRRYNTSQLHGPRNAPPPSLRVRNGTHISPHLRQAADKKSGSPIRKTSQSKSSGASMNTTSRRSSVSMQDELHRKTALLRSLTHAATVGKAGGLPEVNLVKPSPIPSSSIGLSRTPSSHYPDSPHVTSAPSREAELPLQQVRGARMRSKTIANHNLVLPKLRQESTYPPADKPNALSNFSSSPSNISIWEDASVRGDSDNESPQASRRSQNLEKYMHRRSKTALPPADITIAPVKKEPLWKLQQNADLITSRALAFSDNRNPTVTPSGKSPKQNNKDKKASKLDGFWGDKSQTEQKPPVESPTRMRVASNIMGPRQRSHTVSAAPPKARYTQLSTFKTEQGIGLGVDFGRSALRPVPKISNIQKSDSGSSIFLNEMERDGIGKLR